MTTIPASQLVNVVPSVLGAGGNGLDVVGLVLTTNTRVPLGQVVNFATGAAVTTYFGAGTTEDVIANGGTNKGGGYFAGYIGATKVPGSLLFAQYNASAVSAYLRGGNISTLTLAQLQAISGSLNVTIDGLAHNAGSVNLSSATSFSNAATTIATAINGSLAQQSSVTAAIAASTFSITASISGNQMTVSAVGSGTIVNGAAVTGTGVTASTVITGQISGTAGGVGVYAVNNAQVVSSTTISGTYGTMTVSAVGSGALAVGQTVAGSTTLANTIITALGTGVGSTGTYFVNLTQTVASTTLTTSPTAAVVTYDSVSGAFVITSGITGAGSTIAFATGTAAAPLLLTSATGALLSQGAAPTTPSAFMTALLTVNQNWVTFMTAQDPDGGLGGGNTQKQAFAAWETAQNNRFAYVCYDSDVTATNTLPATSSLGYILANDNNSGTALIYDPGNSSNIAAFLMGAAASIDFTRQNGRITFAYKAQSGLVATVSDPTIASNLGGNPQLAASRGNGYNFYGAYSNANSTQVWFQRGFVTGSFSWFDSYINSIWLNNLLQNALLALQGSVGRIPYSPTGYAMIAAALNDPIQAGLTFGAFGPAPLSSLQIANVNAQAQAQISGTLQSQGWYLQIVPAQASVRASRTSPTITFWYIDQGAVQALNLSSVLLT